jgi:hypothetical protein
MSYDFMMFKPVGELRSPDDLSEETTAVIGSVAEIREALSRLYPAIDWSPDGGQGVIFGSLDGPDTWYEFYLYENDPKSFSVHTSFRTNERRLIPEICRELGLIAFDGQVYALLRGED